MFVSVWSYAKKMYFALPLFYFSLLGVVFMKPVFTAWIHCINKRLFLIPVSTRSCIWISLLFQSVALSVPLSGLRNHLLVSRVTLHIIMSNLYLLLFLSCSVISVFSSIWCFISNMYFYSLPLLHFLNSCRSYVIHRYNIKNQFFSFVQQAKTLTPDISVITTVKLWEFACVVLNKNFVTCISYL